MQVLPLSSACSSCPNNLFMVENQQTTLDDIPANFLRHYPQYKNGAFNLTELARLCDISRTTAYKFIGLLEG